MYKGEEFYKERAKIAAMQHHVEGHEYASHISELLDQIAKLKASEKDLHERLLREQQRVIDLEKKPRGPEPLNPGPNDPMAFLKGFN